jgi:hypothetical protein
MDYEKTWLNPYAVLDSSGRGIASNRAVGREGFIQVKVSEFFSDRRARKWFWIGLAVFVALQIYFIQELVVALMLFTGLFVVCALAALVLYLIDRASRWGIGIAGQQAKRALTAAEEISKKQLRRPRSETAQ